MFINLNSPAKLQRVFGMHKFISIILSWYYCDKINRNHKNLRESAVSLVSLYSESCGKGEMLLKNPVFKEIRSSLKIFYNKKLAFGRRKNEYVHLFFIGLYLYLIYGVFNHNRRIVINQFSI